MYFIYSKKTGIPRINIDSESLLDANVLEDEAWIKIEPEDQLDGDFKIVKGEPVAIPPEPEDPVEIARDLRTGLLTECDWTQTVDSALTADEKAQWADYRQKLRDFPALIASEFKQADDEFYSHLYDLLPAKPGGEDAETET